MSDSPSTRKARKKSIDSNNNNGEASSSSTVPHPPPPHGTTSLNSKVPGPPYICPTCNTTYSRLEYLRRHERRHADIRPFVCECGKGFSRSDVLKRHRRQCSAVKPEEEGAETSKRGRGKKAAPAGGEEGGAPAKKRKTKTVQKEDDGDEVEVKKVPQASTSAAPSSSKHPPPPPPASNKRNPGTIGIHQQPQITSSQFLQQQQQQQPSNYNNQWGQSPHGNVNPNSLAHGYSGQGRDGDYGGQKPPPPIQAYMQSGGPLPQHSQMTSLYHSQGPGGTALYSSSPESAASAISPLSSPRNGHREANRATNGSQGGSGMIRYGSGSGLREQIAQGGNGNGSGRGTPPPQPASSGSRHAYPGPEFWNAIDPSLKGGRNETHSNNRNGKSNESAEVGTENGGSSGYNSQSSTGGGPAFSFPSAEQFGQGSSSSQIPSSLPSRSNHPTFESGVAGGTASLAQREPQRFSFSTGPLSPFSNAALSSSTSPYLSAFSNARDTPLVSSPRGSTSGAPGTPGGSGNNSFDWSMRPPTKPANRSSTGGTSGTPGIPTSQPGTSSIAAPVHQDTPTKKGLQAKRLSVGSLANTALSNSASGVSSAGIAAPLLAGVTSSGGSGGGSNTPSRFVSRATGAPSSNYFDLTSDSGTGSIAANVTPSTGPEAFLMGTQNGSSDTRSVPSNLPSAGINVAHLFGLNSNGHLPTPQTPLWDFANMSSGQTSVGLSGTTPSYGLNGPFTNSNQTSSLGWLMSPSIQQLLNSFPEQPSTNGGGGNGNISPSPRPALPTHDSYFPPQRPLTESQVKAGLDDDPDFQAILNSHTEREDGDDSLPTPIPATANTQTNEVTGTMNSTTPRTFTSNAISNGVGVSTPGGTGSLALERAFKDIANPFFIPPTLFRSCYAIAHWALPPVTRLSMLALHSQQNLLKHFPIMHEPTFRLDTTPGCLAFSTCMLGSHEVGRKWWAGEEVVPRSSAIPVRAPSNQANRDPNSSTLVDEEDGQELVKPIVMIEKIEMLTKSFSSRCRAVKDKVSVVQALMLWQANNLLSSDESLRSTAANTFEEAVSLARQAGLFDPSEVHANKDINYTPEEVLKSIISEASDLSFSFSFLPSYLPGCPDEEKLWRRWTDYEGRRRTCHLLWILDTVSCLDEDLPTKLTFEDVRHLPLPSPDTIWRTSTVNSWRSALDEYRGPTVEQAMRQLFSGKNESNFNGEPSPPTSVSNSDGKKVEDSEGPTIFGSHGPFARLILIIAILRGMLEMVDSGRNQSGDGKSFIDEFVVKREDQVSPTSGENKELSAQVMSYRSALAIWRKAWDQDKLCIEASGPNARISPFSPIMSNHGNEVKFKSVTASGATPLCDDALPFYWLSHVLLGHISNNKKLPSRSVPTPPPSAGIDEDNKASAFKKEAADFRSMLKFAKQFVSNGEGAPSNNS